MSEEAKRVGLVGHCAADTARLQTFLRGALGDDTSVVTIRDDEHLITEPCDLLLVNRILDGRFSAPDGLSLIRMLKRRNSEASAMLISNYPDAQADAEKSGALPGFGKRQIGSDEATERLRDACGIRA